MSRPLSLSVALLAGLSGCAGGAKPQPESPKVLEGAVASPVSDSDLPKTLHQLLLSKDRDAESKLRLAGVVQTQLARAESMFASGNEDAAEGVVLGALFLLRQDDALLAATRGHGEALLAAAHRAARSGEAGRARALYRMALAVSNEELNDKDVQAHLTALQEFLAATEGDTALMKSGPRSRDALVGAMFDSSAEAQGEAERQVVEWMGDALQSPIAQEGPKDMTEREEAMEAYRAMRSGAPALIALGIRQGTPLRPLELLESAGLDRAVPAGVASRLQAASEKDDASAWLDLFRLFDSQRRDDSGETSLPPFVADGAALWAAIELYRSSPGRLDHAMPLSMSLVEFGLPEVASAVISGNINQESPREAISWSVSLVLRGLLDLGQTGQIEAARRTYTEAAPLLALASRPGFAAMTPRPARVHALLAALEIRAGHAARALPLLTLAAKQEPSATTSIRLGEVTRQGGDPEAALAHGQEAIALAQKEGDVLTEAQAEEFVFHLYRQLNKPTLAAEAMDRALRRTLTARAMDLGVVSEARVERQLARLLEQFDARQAVRDAYTRALAASRKSPAEIDLTLGDMARSGLSTGDLWLSRRSTESALELGVKNDDLVYLAIWQKFAEERAGVKSDGAVLQVLESTGQLKGWHVTLRDFTLGLVAPGELKKAARGLPEETEADFYSALSQPDGPEKQKLLKQVAQSSSIDLVEVMMARDLTQTAKKLSLPDDIVLP